MSLLQYNEATIDSTIRYTHYSMAQDFGEVIFLGLRKHKQVTKIYIYMPLI